MRTIAQSLLMAGAGLTVLDPTIVGTNNNGASFFINNSGFSGVYALVGSWPGGVSINGTTGVISGIPTAGTYGGLQISFTLSSGVVSLTPIYSRVWVSTGVVISLMRGNGADGSATFTDEVAGGSWINREAPLDNSRISITRSKWGGSSIRQDNDDIIQRNTGLTDFTLSGDFTIEAWVYLDEATTFTFGRLVCGLYNNITDEGITLCARSAGPALLYANEAEMYHAAGVSLTGRWAHIHCGRSGSTLYTGSDGSTSSRTTSSSIATCGRAVLGGIGLNTVSYIYLDDMRITKGSCLYTGSYTVPTAQFPTP